MRFLRQTLLLILVIFTFVGSIGMGVYSHFCSKDGIEQSYFIQQEHHCEAITKNLPACCQKESVEIEKECCSDEVHFIQTDFDYFQQHSVFSFMLFALPTAEYEHTIEPIVVAEISTDNLANPPPKLSGKEILIKNQVFRI
ncbi:MAG: hypothetical protein WC044_01495 [Crocinitomicaceae bacterium]